METTKQTQTWRKSIETQATGAFGYNPIAKVVCPHCGGVMQAIDARKHVR